MAEQRNGQDGQQQWNRLYFDEWVGREGLELIRGYKVDNVYTVPLKPWARTGGNAVQIQLDGTGELNAAYVQEIPPGKQLTPQKHLYEEVVYVLGGRGSTTVWYDGKRKNSFEWGAGSLFAIPLNAWYQHFNGSGTEPARYLAMNTAPITMNLIRNDEFIFNNPATFPERYDSADNFFSAEIEERPFNAYDIPLMLTYTNFYADIHAIALEELNRGVDTHGRLFEFHHGLLTAHLAQFPSGTFSKLHRHGPGAHVVWLRGEGYSVLFPDGGEKQQEYWGPGTMLVPPAWWWHQHCVASREDGLHLALKLGSKQYHVNRLSSATLKSTRSGGSQMNYEDFPPALMEELRGLFERECAKRDTPTRMDVVYEG
jgi:mannose-6-phosphate isomerase-like protein (cupin superfamily)